MRQRVITINKVESVMRLALFLLFSLVATASLLANEAPDGTTFTHAVLSVDGPDMVRIRFCGVPITVRLANVKTKGGDVEAQELKYLRDTLKAGTQVRI